MDVINEREERMGFPESDYKNGKLKKVRWRVVKKLFSYDFSAIIKILYPFFVGIIAIALMAMVYIILSFKYPDSHSIFTTSFFTIMFFVFGIFACIIAPFAVCETRYTKNFFGKAGYLVLSLPVSGMEHVLSKFLSFYAVFLLSIVSIGVSVGIVCIATLFVPTNDLIVEILQYIITSNTVMLNIEQIILSILSTISIYFVINSLVCFLSSKTKKQQGWIIFGIVMCFYHLGYLFIAIIFIIQIDFLGAVWFEHLSNVFEILFNLALIIGGFIYQAHYLEKKVNLQ